MPTKKIKTGLRHPKNKDMVFCAIYCPLAQPYLNYDHIEDKLKPTVVPLVLMQVRWDGYLGFPGGNVDPGEELLPAVLRELDEEINYQPNEEISLMCSFSQTDRHIHCFSHAIHEEKVVEIIRQSTYARHFLAENQGLFAFQMKNFGKDGWSVFRKNKFKGSAGEELDVLHKIIAQKKYTLPPKNRWGFPTRLPVHKPTKLTPISDDTNAGSFVQEITGQVMKMSNTELADSVPAIFDEVDRFHQRRDERWQQERREMEERFRKCPPMQDFGPGTPNRIR